MLGRYFYFEANGSDKSGYTHYVEIQIVDKDGVNRALGRGLLRYNGIPNRDPSVAFDGSIDVTNYFNLSDGVSYIVIDLGDVYDISYIKIWRYYADGRTYKDVFVKVSTDDVDYTTVFSSAENGTYAETEAGYQIDLPEEPEDFTTMTVRLPEIQAMTADKVGSPSSPWTADYCRIQGSNGWIYRTFLQYDLSAIPTGAKIKSAKLKVYCCRWGDYAFDGTTNISRVTQEWDEATLTWNNQPGFDGTYLPSNVSPPSVGSWSDWDITSLVREWVDGTYPNYGLYIKNNNDDDYRVYWDISCHKTPDGKASFIKVEYEPYGSEPIEPDKPKVKYKILHNGGKLKKAYHNGVTEIWRCSTPYYAIENGKLVECPNAISEEKGGHSVSKGELSSPICCYGVYAHTSGDDQYWGAYTGDMDTKDCETLSFTVTTFEQNGHANSRAYTVYGDGVVINTGNVERSTSKNVTVDVSNYKTVAIRVRIGVGSGADDWVGVGFTEVKFY